MSCHDGSNPHLPNLSGYDNIKKVTEQDTGTDIFTLVRVSHIHLFGITFIFFLVGTIFSHAYVRPVWLKCSLMAAPFICLFIDVISWYLVKVYHPFAWVTMGAGGLMGLCFASMWVDIDVSDVVPAHTQTGPGPDGAVAPGDRLKTRPPQRLPPRSCRWSSQFRDAQ